MSTFDICFDMVIGHEGGLVDNQKDPGGETKFGISKRAYPNEDIPNISLVRAKEIYQRDYWSKCRCDSFAPVVAFSLFDSAVNHGVDRAIKLMQQTVGVETDGLIGPKTLKAISIFPLESFRAEFNANRLDYYTSLPAWPTFGKGWARRVASNLRLDV